MSERSRAEFIEVEEQPRRQRERSVRPPRARVPKQEQEQAQKALLAPPGAAQAWVESPFLDPIEPRFPFAGETDFHYLYRQIARVAEGLGGSGPMAPALDDLADVVITNPQNGDVLTYQDGDWINQAGGGGGASLSVANTWTAVQSFCIDDANNNVQRPVTLCHTHSGDLAAAPIGVGMAFEVELALGGAKQTIAQIDADTTALGSSAGSETGRLLFNVTSAGTENNELALYPQQLTIPRAPLASATRARVQIGSANWHFGGGVPAGALNHGDTSGCVLGINEPTGYGGLLLAAAVAGVPRFTINSDAEHTARIVDTSTTGPVTVLALEHRLSSGTASVGIGAALEFKQPSDAGTLRVGAKIHSETTDATNAAENVRLVFTNRIAGTDTETASFSGSTGNFNSLFAVQATNGFLAGTLTGKAALVDIQAPAEAAPLPADYTALKVTSGALTGIPVGAVPNDITFNLGSTHQLATGNRSAAYNVQISPPSWSAVGATQIDIAAAVQIGVPLAGTNVTIPERYSLQCSGPIYIEAAVNGAVFRLPESATTTVGAQTGRIPINVNNTIYYIPYYAGS